DIQVLLSEPSQLQKGNLQLVLGGFRSGFELTEANLIVLTEHELFAKVNRHQARRQTMSNEQRLKSYTDLKVGDYVVHVNHGIGKYLGMETIEVSGRHQDYMTLLYKDDAKLFIPVSQIDRIQKYVSSEAKQPQIASLTSDKWRKTKSRVARKIEDIADELVELYAKRESEQGYAFSKDDSYQKEFEDAFPYTETPDQLRSSQEIKRDMEMTKPMDRLLIGDVGFGKTEVALRAAFKAIQDGKQVALLAPTTVLVQQHYETILNRFDSFPVSVGILSRFSSPTEVKQTLQDLRLGLIDIIVGTHRLLSKDVKFADLGLLIIDEEQRFGVKHKERLKELKASVDVLTLTATPIPRTLNLSMLGVRDLSVIETAPLNRYPIQTYVLEQNFGVVIDGIKRELARGGQVFYLHNRVEDIESVANEIRALVADARVAYIHGQMTESQLERVLMDFIAGEYDVLVTTTIIETGVDIPNANTLFVENADKMGLAQLYQLRGRVGRSNRIAYAYFMYQPDKVLTETGEKRLEAIKDFTELGSGFKIAMRDLAIRGAGNILGKQQHGFIDSVGYDLYTQMLNTAIAKKQGKKVQAKTDAEINLEIEAYLPTEYIEDARQKIEIYKRIGQFENLEQYREVQTDLIDRFGDYPQEVANLLEIGLLKMYADLALIEKIKQIGNKVTVLLAEKFVKQVPAQALLKVLAQTKLVTKLVPKKEQVQIEWVLQPTVDTAQELSQLKELAQLLGKELQAKKG
ncbi:MAG: transcription-repair coupling factor, partial [Ligilactobacillus agilis]|nr:transcription-repair coupling factor [Ligilactobacillus agilis]